MLMKPHICSLNYLLLGLPCVQFYYRSPRYYLATWVHSVVCFTPKKATIQMMIFITHSFLWHWTKIGGSMVSVLKMILCLWLLSKSRLYSFRFVQVIWSDGLMLGLTLIKCLILDINLSNIALSLPSEGNSLYYGYK